MKSGASDPFGDDADEEEEEETPEEAVAAESDAGEVADAAVAETRRDETPEPSGSDTPAQTGGSAPQSESSASESAGSADDGGGDGGGLSREQLPYVLRRERVKDERPEVHQLFVQQETHEEAVEAERRLEDALDEDLSRTDAREAIYRAGMQHLDDAEAILREWGYDL